jgi:hypothetical protein
MEEGKPREIPCAGLRKLGSNDLLKLFSRAELEFGVPENLNGRW